MALLSSRVNNLGLVNFDALQTVDSELLFEAGATIDLTSLFFAFPGRYTLYKYGTLTGFDLITTANVLTHPGITCSSIVNEPVGKYIIVTLE